MLKPNWRSESLRIYTASESRQWINAFSTQLFLQNSPRSNHLRLWSHWSNPLPVSLNISALVHILNGGLNSSQRFSGMSNRCLSVFTLGLCGPESEARDDLVSPLRVYAVCFLYAREAAVADQLQHKHMEQ